MKREKRWNSGSAFSLYCGFVNNNTRIEEPNKNEQKINDEKRKEG